MASPLIIDGKATAATIQEELHQEVERLQKEDNILPGLAVILVGERVDSATYVRMKKKTAAAIGIHSVDVNLPDSVTQDELLQEVEKLNQNDKVHGILVQLPLPDHIDEATVLKAIAVEKDADGFSALSKSGMISLVIIWWFCILLKASFSTNSILTSDRYWKSVPPRRRATAGRSVHTCRMH